MTAAQQRGQALFSGNTHSANKSQRVWLPFQQQSNDDLNQGIDSFVSSLLADKKANSLPNSPHRHM